MLLAGDCVPSLLSVMNGAEIDVPYPPICTDVGWIAIKLVATPICAFCGAAAGR